MRAESGARARASAPAHHTESNIEEIARLLEVAQTEAPQAPAMVGTPQLA
jgi:hypothetical protein